MEGGGKCSICGSLGTSKLSCPLNPNSKNKNDKKHYLALNIRPDKTVKNYKKPSKTLKKPSKTLKKVDKTVKKPNKTIKKIIKVDDIKLYLKDKNNNDKKIEINKFNPKNKSSKAYDRYERYKYADKLIDIKNLGGSLGDIINDYNKGYLIIYDDNVDNKRLSKSLKKSDILDLKEHKDMINFKNFLDKIHSISGICDYGRIDLTSGPILLNMGDLHTWDERNNIETDNKWGNFCKNNNNMNKLLIKYEKNKFIHVNNYFFNKPIDLNLSSILKKNEIFISYFILYILKNFKNVHLFLEFHSNKGNYNNNGRWSTPMFFNKAMIEMSRNKPQFMKDNNNFIHYNDFRDRNYIFYNLFKCLKDSEFKYGDINSLGKNMTTALSKKEYIDLIKNIYVQVFLQGFKISKKNEKWKRELNKYMKYDNKDILSIIQDMDVDSQDIKLLIDEVKYISSKEKNHTIKINGETIHCTRLSKQLLKLKPEIQEKVVKWFYDLIISKFIYILHYDVSNELQISYIFWIMFIDFYNLCRILYYTGFGNTEIDMSNNIILNYGGENMYLDKPSKFAFFNILDNNTGGHASSVLLFYRKYLYGDSSGNKYIEKPTNNSIGQKRHYYVKNDNIEIKKYLSRYIENRKEGRDCVEIK